MNNFAKSDQGLWLKNPVFISFSFALVVFIVRVFLRATTLEMDEAEQVVMAQQLLPGYPAQPPLYTWLQYGLFSLFGRSLASIALLKSTLLWGSLYCFHRICRLHCSSHAFAWCATAAWAFLPAISYDLMKDNTHSVFVLLAASLTWYWFVAPSRLNKPLWYFLFGVITGIGLLSKFNYLLFLALLFLSACTVPQYRKKVIHPGMLLSLAVAMLLASPYFFWLINHPNLGLHSSYKFMPNEHLGYGVFKLVIAMAYFILPFLLVSYSFFPLRRGIPPSTVANQLLLRFHLISVPFLLALVLLGGIGHIETRWLIPILFLFPVLYFSFQQGEPSHYAAFLLACILVQSLLFASLIYRSHFGHTARNRFPVHLAVEDIKKEKRRFEHIASDSFWILGNLMIDLSIKTGWLIHPAALPATLPANTLFVWQTTTPPEWTNYFLPPTTVVQSKTIVEPLHLSVKGGFVY
ncbi:MAG: glycosyltransferase family 39 protein [Tatlockia sp.]|jgi:4-amino-4-deoxy-L-arabinose transferase-like glycosyltransferase